ncbi:hypothetical protein [Halogranum rubrum]|nr:hypothetical protein [Halogranum rubrum]
MSTADTTASAHDEEPQTASGNYLVEYEERVYWTWFDIDESTATPG